VSRRGAGAVVGVVVRAGLGQGRGDRDGCAGRAETPARPSSSPARTGAGASSSFRGHGDDPPADVGVDRGEGQGSGVGARSGADTVGSNSRIAGFVMGRLPGRGFCRDAESLVPRVFRVQLCDRGPLTTLGSLDREYFPGSSTIKHSAGGWPPKMPRPSLSLHQGLRPLHRPLVAQREIEIFPSGRQDSPFETQLIARSLWRMDAM